MATPSLFLIRSIRESAKNLASQAPYQWGHMGSCNCGHLAQEITQVSKADIHRFAMKGDGDWTSQSRSYQPPPPNCSTSGLPMDQLFSTMLDSGLEVKDIEYLENLSDPRVLKHLGVTKLKFNQRQHVILYMEAWASLLEVQLLKGIPLDDLKQPLIKNVTTP